MLFECAMSDRMTNANVRESFGLYFMIKFSSIIISEILTRLSYLVEGCKKKSGIVMFLPQIKFFVGKE